MEIYIGILGATLILIAFLLNQQHVWKDTDFKYDFTNFVGSTILIYYSVITETWPFVILNLVWAAVSFKDLIKK